MFPCDKRLILQLVMERLAVRLGVVLFVWYGCQGIVINNCINNKVEIFEDSPVHVICGDINSEVEVTWQLTSEIIGKCDSHGRCTDGGDYQLSRQRKSTESQVRIVSNYRHQGGLIITCQEMRSFYTASCTLVIKRHSVLTGCHVSLNNVTGTVSGSCHVQEAFSSDNNYSCTWTVNSAVINEFFLAESFDNCSFTQPVQGPGLYNYTILVNPPPTAGFSQDVEIVEPGDVTTSCPHSVVSGRDLSCTCQTTNTASPPATVRWEGRDSEKLVKTNVQREDNGTQFTCHVAWAGRVYTSINYTLLVDSKKNGAVIEVTVNSPSYLSTDRDLIFSTSAIQSIHGTQGGATVSPLLTSTTEIKIIGGAAAGGVVIVSSLLIIYFMRRKKQSHDALRDIATSKARRVSRFSSSTANIQQPEGQTLSKGNSQYNLNDFEDHINEVYESLDKILQRISDKETCLRTDEDCPYYNDINKVCDNKNNPYYNDQSPSLHQTHARPSGKTTNTVCEHRLSMDPWFQHDTSHNGFEEEEDCVRRLSKTRSKRKPEDLSLGLRV